MQIETELSRGSKGATENGWQAVSLIALPAVKNRSLTSYSTVRFTAYLQLSTFKRSTHVIGTSAFVFFEGPQTRIHTEGRGYIEGTYADGAGDYSRMVREGQGVGTEKKINSFHKRSLEALPEILREVARHYSLATVDDLFKEPEGL